MMNGSIKKVIYISHAQLSEKIVRDWYIDDLRLKGMNVEFWDLTHLLFDKLIEANTIHTDYLFTIRTYDEIEKRLRYPENKDATYIILVNYYGRVVRLYRLLSRYNCKLFFMAWGAFPYRTKPNWQKTIHGLFDPLKLTERVLGKAKAFLYKKLKLIKPFDVVFGAGYAILKNFPDALKVVPTNLPDYDQYVKAKTKTTNLVDGRYIVFIDAYGPLHPDLKIKGFGIADANRYFLSLNRFLNLLEKRFGMKVVIAAHPQSDYDNDTFQGRKIYSGRTEELVRDAEIVISHYSTSISYAVLNEKPAIFIYTDDMKRPYKDSLAMKIHDFANYLDAKIYNIDEMSRCDQIDVSDINLECYEKYKYNYLTTRESEHTTALEIFWREIINN
ncbi:MAG: hypothetical protein FVQ84_04115 [Planctomycetes bacterium]|nr:hypothetical protein [Planctomycetota bacterium]